MFKKCIVFAVLICSFSIMVFSVVFLFFSICASPSEDTLMIVWRVSVSHGRPSPWSKRVDFTPSRWDGQGMAVQGADWHDLALWHVETDVLKGNGYIQYIDDHRNHRCT